MKQYYFKFCLDQIMNDLKCFNIYNSEKYTK